MPRKHKPAKEPIQVERKFTWGATATALYAGLVSWFYNNPHALDDYLPTWARTLLLVVVGVGGVGGAIYKAPHTTRSDVPKTATGTAAADPVRTATVKVVADTSGFVAAIEAAKAHVEQLTEAVPVPAPFTGDTPSPYTGGGVVQDPDAPPAAHRTPRKRTAKKAAQS